MHYHMENKRRDRVEGGPPAKGVVLDVINQHDLAPGKSFCAFSWTHSMI
jgi:hypothetical protein